MPEYTGNDDDDLARARAIVELADKINLDRDIQEVTFEVFDLGDTDSTPVHRLIRDSFQSDDDFDDLRHEIEHVLGDCRDTDPDCQWNDSDELD